MPGSLKSSDNSPDSSYNDNDPANGTYDVRQYTIIPWSTRGSQQLTTKSALFFLALMATHGESHIDSMYPDLDTWQRLLEGEFVHSTSGAKTPSLSSSECCGSQIRFGMVRNKPSIPTTVLVICKQKRWTRTIYKRKRQIT